MKLFCPHCLKPITVPDEAAGTDTTCPECGKSFPAPARYNPVVNVEPPPVAPVPPTPLPQPVPPPGLVPSAPADAPPPGLVPTVLAPQPQFPPTPAGYTR